MTYLITGGTGSFGTTMLNDLLVNTNEEIRVFSRDESKQDYLRNKINNNRVKFFIGDVRDRESVIKAMRGAKYVFHAAAMKQVPSCEFFPMQAVQTNIIGSENVIRAAIDLEVDSLVCLSTDKAVFPVNAMGTSKAMMEKLTLSAARELASLNSKTTLSCVRYGNVLYSRGSVIPLFVNQIQSNRPLTITEPKMTRFLMPLRDSVSLVHHAFKNASQGDIFIKKAPACTVEVLANAILDIMNAKNHPIENIGWRHGEKLYETLASSLELSNSVITDEHICISNDQRDLNYRKYFYEGTIEASCKEDYHSHNAVQLEHDDVKKLLLSLPEIQSLTTLNS